MKRFTVGTLLAFVFCLLIVGIAGLANHQSVSPLNERSAVDIVVIVGTTLVFCALTGGWGAVHLGSEADKYNIFTKN